MSSKHLVIYLLLLLLVGCGYDRHEACAPLLGEGIPTLHLSQLSSYAEGGDMLPEGAIIRGRVVANDASGNFYRTIVIEDEGVGVEIRLALYDLHALYPMGCWVTVRCGGCRVIRIDGVLTLGREVYAHSGGVVEPIAPRSEVLSRVEVVEMDAPAEPLQVELGGLSESLCGRLVEIGGLHYEGEEKTWGSVEYVGNADRVLLDSQGQEVRVRTSHYADFASVGIPEGELTVRGILYKEGERYVVKPRVREDIVEEYEDV